MEVIVLGASAAYPRSGGACSGYLIRDKNANLLIDCGTGVLSNLFRWIDPVHLDAIAITHLHTDHFLDLYPLRYYLYYEKKPSSPIPVLIPANGEKHILRLVSEESQDFFSQVFRFSDINTESTKKIGSLRLKSFLVPHYKETYGLLVEGSKKVVYSSDCGFGCKPVLRKEALGADLIICEATLQKKIDSLTEGHLTAEQAGEVAAAVKAKKLLLTHIWGGLDPKISKSQAEKIFGGEVLFAVENQKLEV